MMPKVVFLSKGDRKGKLEITHAETRERMEEYADGAIEARYMDLWVEVRCDCGKVGEDWIDEWGRDCGQEGCEARRIDPIGELPKPRGRPLRGKSRRVSTPVMMDQEMIDRLKSLAGRKGVSFSEMVNQMCGLGLDWVGKVEEV